MYKNKNRRIMRHPYATLTVLSLATAGAISLTQKGKQLLKDKTACLTQMMGKNRQ